MKKVFSTKWKASSRPGKKRKYVAKAPLHIKRKFLGAMLSKELRKKYSKKTMPVRKDDRVKILAGGFKGKEGKVTRIFTGLSKITIENIQRKKRDGSKVDVKIYPSNVVITELALNDRKRMEMHKKETNIKENAEVGKK